MNGLFVTATDTDAGKTWIGAQLLRELKHRSIPIQARKPVESGWPDDAENIQQTDAWQLGNAAEQLDALAHICPNRFRAALSPERAAMLEGKRCTLAQLKQDCLRHTSPSDFLFVEGAGGLYSPICEDALNADLAAALNLPVLLVVENRLGCINQALLNVEVLAHRGLQLKAIALNATQASKSTEQHMDNASDIKKRVSCELVSFAYGEADSQAIRQLVHSILEE